MAQSGPGNIVDVQDNSFQISVTPTVSIASNYAQFDAVGGLLTFANAARATGKSITILGATITNKSIIVPRLALHFAREIFTSGGDGNPHDPSDTDVRKFFSRLEFLDGDWYKGAANSSFAHRPSYLFQKMTGTSLFAQLVFLDAAPIDFIAIDDLQVTVYGTQG